MCSSSPQRRIDSPSVGRSAPLLSCWLLFAAVVFGGVVVRPAGAAAASDRIGLEWLPSSGFLIPSPEEFVRLETTNASEVRVRARWITESEALATWGGAPNPEQSLARSGDRLGDWILDEAWTPDSLGRTTRDYPLGSLPNLPQDVQGIYIEARSGGRDLTWEETNDPGQVVSHAVLQFASIGISSHLGTGAGILWVTDLLGGEPIEGAAVSLWDGTLGPESGPLFTGVTDEDGLLWTPGTQVLEPAGTPRAARAASGSRSVWLPLEAPTPTSDPADSGDRALLCTDRDRYTPEDRLRWQLLSVRREGSSLHWNPGPRFTLHLDGPLDGTELPYGTPPSRSWTVRTDRRFETQGVLNLPRTSGNYRLRLTTEDGGRELHSVPFRIMNADDPRLGIDLRGEKRSLVGGEKLSLEGRITDGIGTPLRSLPVEWTVETVPLEAPPPPTFPAFRFAGSIDAGDRPQVTVRGGESTDAEGRVRATVEIEGTDGRQIPSTIRVRLRPKVQPAGGSEEFGWNWHPGTLRVGVRDAGADRDHRGGLVWEWVVVDADGTAVPDVPVDVELRRIDPGEESLLWSRKARSENGPSRLAIERPGPGDYTLRVALPDGTVAESRKDASSETSTASSFVRADSGGTTLGLTVAGTPLAGAPTLFVVERGDVLAAKAETVPGNGRLGLPLPPLPPPSARLHVTQIGSDPSRVRFEGGLRARLPFYRRTDLRVASDTPEHRVDVAIEVDESGAPRDSLQLSISVRTPEGIRPQGRLTISISEIEPHAGSVPETPMTRTDLLSGIFGPDPALPGHSDVRDHLALSGRSSTLEAAGEPAGVEPPSAVHDTEGAESLGESGALPERLVLWKSDLEVPAGSGLRFQLPVDVGKGRSSSYRVRVWARTQDVRFGYAESIVGRRESVELEIGELGELRVGDQARWPVRIRNRGDGRWEGRIDLNLTGAKLVRSPGDVRVEGGEIWNGSIEIEVPEPGSYVLEARLEDDSGQVVQTRRVHGGIVDPMIGVERIRSGIAAPRSEEELDLDGGPLLAADGIEIHLAPTYFLELRDPVVAALEDDLPDPDREITRLAAAALAALYPDWIGYDKDRLDAIARKSSSRLEAAGIPLGPSFEIPLTDLVPDEKFRPFRLDARARWAAALALEAGLPVAHNWKSQLDRAGREYRERVRENLARPQLEIAAFHTWIDQLGTQGTTVEADLVWLLARETRLGERGRIWLALCGSGSRPEEISPALRPQLDAQFRTLLRDHDERIGSGETAVLVDGSVTTSALLLELLARRTPNHRIVPSLLRGLLEARERDGRWIDPIEGAWASHAIATLLGVVEAPDRTRRAEIVLGAASSHAVRFDPARPGIESLRFDLETLSRMRRKDPSRTGLGIELATDRAAALHYQIRTKEETSALLARPTEGPVRIERLYLDAEGRAVPGKKEDGFRRLDLGKARCVSVELTIDLDSATAGLFVSEPLPPGATFRGWIGERTPGTTSLERNSVRGIDSLDFLTGPLPAGQHVLRYGLLLPSEGRFRIPGPEARSVDGDGVRSRGTPLVLRVG